MSSRIPFDFDHRYARAIQDSIASSLSHQWLRRAEEFERAKPRPDDFRGRATDEQLAEQAARLTAKADACRHRADVCELSEVEKLVVLDFVQVALVAARTVPREVAA